MTTLIRLYIFLIAAALSHGASITGKVIGIGDGDTLTTLTPAYCN